MAEDVGVPRQAARATPRVRARPAKKRTRQVRWSALRERRFLAALAETGNVAASCRAAGLADSTVYRRRQSDPAFREAWVEALREGYVRLETMLLERALNGVDKPVWHGGKQVGTAREYSDRLALALLAAHRGTVTGASPRLPSAPMGDAEARAELARRLDEMGGRLRAEA